HPDDNVLVALQDLEEGELVTFEGLSFAIPNRVKAKQKLPFTSLPVIGDIKWIGWRLGRASNDLIQGQLLTTTNTIHAAEDFTLKERKTHWVEPDSTRFSGRMFKGFHRRNGTVGTANHWLVIPLVFCENRNIQVMKDALEEQLG